MRDKHVYNRIIGRNFEKYQNDKTLINEIRTKKSMESRKIKIIFQKENWLKKNIWE